MTSSQQQGIVLQEAYFADRQVTTNDNVGYFVLPKGYFTYRSRSDTDVFVFNRNDILDKGIISYYYPVFQTKYTCSDFLLRRLNHGIRKQLAMAAEGTGQKVLAHSKFKNMTVSVPKIGEQQKIGTFFRQLDRLITLHQCNCNMATRPCEWSSGLRAIAWEQREFKNLFKILPNNTLSRAELSFEKGIVKNLHYGDILIKFNEILDSCDKKIPFISREMNFEKIKNAILKNGDVVIADAAEDEAVGKCTEIFNISQNEQIISGLHTIPCRPNIDFAQGFLGYYMNSNSYHSQLVPLMQGIKVLSLSKSSLQDTLITFPRTKKEQARIGTFFRHLDRLITLHQRKHVLLT